MTFLRALGAFLLDLLGNWDAPPAPAGWQPRYAGLTTPPRAPADWSPPAGAINPITQRPFRELV